MFDEDRHIRQEIRQLSKRMKQNPQLFARLGDCYLRLGEVERAESVLKEGVGALHDYPNGYRVLAEVQFWRGFYRDAEESCLQGLQHEPNHLGLLHLLMRIKKKADNDWEAGQLQATLARLDPLHAPEILIAAESAAPDETTTSVPSPKEVWKLKAARRTRPDEKAPATDPPPPATDNLQLQKYLNEILESSEAEGPAGEPDETSDALSPPQAGIATKTLGELYASQEKYEEAIEVFRRLLDSDLANESYRIRLQELIQLQEATAEKGKTK